MMKETTAKKAPKKRKERDLGTPTVIVRYLDETPEQVAQNRRCVEAAMNVADNSEETELYSDLSIDIESLRDDAQSLYEKLIQKKNAAPAAGTAETAKESCNHSDLSIDKILENVKGSFLLAEQNPDGGVDVTANIKLGDDLIAVCGAVVSVIYYIAQKQKLSTDTLTEI